MFGFLIYDLKVAALVAVFYMFYRLLLSRDTLHRLNRVVLLATAVASFILPLCVITMHKTVVMPQPTGKITAELPLTAVMEPSQPWWQQAAVAVFFIGIIVTLGHLLWSVGQVVRLIRNSEQRPQADGTIVCVTDKDVSPFSWLRYIVLNRKDYESPDPAIMAHERGHIRQRHSLDVLLVDTLTVLQWFNPAMWMLRQDLRAIHEYEADAAVLSQGINMRQYQYLLIQKAVVACGYSVANGITHSTLKNRITMMLNNKKSNRKSMFKLLALLPIVGIALALNAETVTDYVYQQPQKKVVKKGRKNGEVKLNGQTISVKTDTATYKGVNVNVDMKETDQLANPIFILNGERVDYQKVQTLKSEDIDHIDVLKDKAAIELYGKDAKNGVVIITTKTAPIQDLSEATVQVIAFKDAKAEDAEFQDVFDVVEHMPEFPGGMESLMKFLAENVHYPEAASKAGIQGRVLVQFIVETNGRVSNVKVVRKVNDDLDAEAIRVVGSMPAWKPGMQNDKAVRVKYTLPLTFRLD